MPGRRGDVVATLAAAVVPTFTWIRRRNSVAAGLTAAIDLVAAIIVTWIVLTRTDIGSATQPSVLYLATGAVVAVLAARLVSSLVVFVDAVRWRDTTQATAGLAAVVVTVALTVFATSQVTPFWRALDVFPETGGLPAVPTPTPELTSTSTSTSTSTAPTTTVPGTTVDVNTTDVLQTAPPVTQAPATVPPTAAPTTSPQPAAGYLTVLIVGGDAGEGRYGVRTDSMNLLGIDPNTGDSFLIGIPRNIKPAPVPPSLTGRFPNGFTDLLNAAYQWGEQNPKAAPDPNHPGGSTLKAIVAELTGVTVQYYLRVDMAGFVDLVDAVGGVTVENLRPAPLSQLPGDPTPIPANLNVGTHRLDGRLALAYSRSRSADSDYQRMARQRCVLTGLAFELRQRPTLDTATSVADAIADNARTDLPRDLLPTFATALTRMNFDTARALALTPPQFPQNPDLRAVRAAVAATITSPAPVVGGTAPPEVPYTGIAGIGEGGDRTVCRTVRTGT